MIVIDDKGNRGITSNLCKIVLLGQEWVELVVYYSFNWDLVQWGIHFIEGTYLHDWIWVWIPWLFWHQPSIQNFQYHADIIVRRWYSRRVPSSCQLLRRLQHHRVFRLFLQNWIYVEHSIRGYDWYHSYWLQSIYHDESSNHRVNRDDDSWCKYRNDWRSSLFQEPMRI